MSMILAQSFMKQLKRLTEREQGMVSNSVLGLQYDPTAARHNLHKVDGNAGWWSAYVNGDLRIILRKQIDGKSMMIICWADHHDAAYVWARNHVLQQHPTTGAMQIVEIPEVKGEAGGGESGPCGARTLPCAALGITIDELLAFGIPEVWVSSVLNAKTEDELLEIGEHLPPEAAEAVLKIAVGEKPEIAAAEKTPEQTEQTDKPFEREVDKQSWWVVTDDDDLKSALSDSAWGTWCTYLHPSQRAIAERTYDSVYRVSGSAGTGKTVAALHHARYVLRNVPGSVVLVTTFSDNLATDLNYRIKPLMRPRELERCDTRTFVDFGRETYDKVCPDHPRLLAEDELKDVVLGICREKRNELPKGISPEFAASEFGRVVDTRGISTWPEYRDALRRGVFRRLSEDRRSALWRVFESVFEYFKLNGCISANGMFKELARFYCSGNELH